MAVEVRDLALASYTWSKSIDDASALLVTLAEPAFSQDSYNARADRSLSTFHASHRFSLSEVVELPFPKVLGNAKGLRALLADWHVGGILTIQSGRPFTVNRSIPQSATSADFGVFDRPDAIADPYTAGLIFVNPDPACHATVSAGAAQLMNSYSSSSVNPAFAAPGTRSNQSMAAAITN